MSTLIQGIKNGHTIDNRKSSESTIVSCIKFTFDSAPTYHNAPSVDDAYLSGVLLSGILLGSILLGSGLLGGSLLGNGLLGLLLLGLLLLLDDLLLGFLLGELDGARLTLGLGKVTGLNTALDGSVEVLIRVVANFVVAENVLLQGLAGRAVALLEVDEGGNDHLLKTQRNHQKVRQRGVIVSMVVMYQTSRRR